MLKTYLLLGFAVLGLAGAARAEEVAKFDVLEYQIDGSTLLSQLRVERAVYPFLGEQKTLADVELARSELEKAYHDAGYLTAVVSIPAQKVESGVVHLAVVEAPVGRLRVVESHYFSLGQIKSEVPELQEGHVPQFDQLQEQMVQANRSPDRHITPVLRPGREAGTLEAELKVEDQLPLHASLQADNRVSDGTSPTRVAASLRWDNLWGRLHSVGLSLSGAPERPADSRVLSLNYSVPLQSGNTLAAYAVHSESDVAVVGGIESIGAGDILGIRYLVALPGSAASATQPAFFHTLTLGADSKDFHQSVNILGSGGFNTPIHYLPMTAGWDGHWNDAQHDTHIGLAFNFHIPGLVGTEQEFADKRFRGRPSYAYLHGSLGRKQILSGGWTLEGRSTWQYTRQALVSNEQFSIGGADTVRGYYESAATGENGLALTLEAGTPNLISMGDGLLRDLRLLAFTDAAQVSVIDPLFATSSYNLAGSGVGLRASGARGLALQLDWSVAANSAGSVQAGDNRLNFRMSYEW
jgi:hemolysin activation/secretion protein